LLRDPEHLQIALEGALDNRRRDNIGDRWLFVSGDGYLPAGKRNVP
jgi:hypothetical protein